MGIRIRPICEKDKKEMSGRVTHVIQSVSVEGCDSVESPSIFDDKTERRNGLVSTSLYNKRGYIPLCMPILNFFLAGDKGEFLGKILNTDLSTIIAGHVIYDLNKHEEIHINKIGVGMTYSENILIGADYIKYLINQLNVEHEIESILQGIVFSCVPISLRNGLQGVAGAVQKGSGDIWLIEDYYFKYIDELNIEEIRNELDSCVEHEMFKVVNNHKCRLTLLLSLKNNKSRLEHMIQDFMVVLPLGYRPTLGRKRHPITKAYNRVVKCNNDLVTAVRYSRGELRTIIACYRELSNAVKNVTVKTVNLYDKNNIPILDTLLGKTGHIRDRMHGARADYTGRGVIVVDPDMPFDTVGIPEKMAVKLMELDIIKTYKTRCTNKSDILENDLHGLRKSLATSLLEDEYILTGRQPTLYYLGIQGFKVRIVKGNAIVLNPLSTPAFNADFDGDQMHTSVPITKKAKEEVKKLMSSTNNLFAPRNGELHTGPRQEILYGLWKASVLKPNDKSKHITMNKTEDIYAEVFDGVCTRRIEAYDVIIVDGKEHTAGIIAIKACLGKKYRSYKIGVVPLIESNISEDESGVVTSKWLKAILQDAAENNKSKFVSMINNMVKLGFAVSKYFPPNISILDYPDVSNLISEFDKKVKEREEWYNMGFETEQSFSSFYSKEYTALEAAVKDELLSELGSDNGYLQMVKSGARGSMSNIVQLFGMKGQVVKNDREAFNAIIRPPIVSQLNELEHFVTAFGARKGMRDKVIETYEPGYIYRQMSHTCPSMYITKEDCGTTEGLLLDYDNMKQFIPHEQFKVGDNEHNNKLVKNFVVKLLVGRFIVGVGQEVTSIDRAEDIYDAMIARVENGELIKLDGVKLRSPLTCEDPCCVKCYGRDLCTNSMTVVGQPVGFVAAQAIGEPGTQLTMKAFQSGGVAGVVNLTSSFSLLDKYLNLSTFQPEKASDPITYDFISPVSGETKVISQGDGTKLLKIMQENEKGTYVNKLRSKVVLYEDVAIKDYVNKGDSIQVVQGDLSIKEIMENRSVEEAQRYLVFRLYNIFLREVEVNLKHFEILVASLSYYLCMKGNQYFKVGCFYTTQEYHTHNIEGCVFKKTMIGTKYVSGYRTDICAATFTENFRSNMQRAIVMSGYDSLTNPIVRSMFGLSLGVGSDIPGYLDKRGKV